MRFITKFKEQGTILFVSHDTAAVVNLCDRCVWLDAGRLRKVGPARDVCEEYAAAIAGESESPDVFKIGGVRKGGPMAVSDQTDVRREILRGSNARNTIEVFDFDPNAPWFGTKGVAITGIHFTDPAGAKLLTLDGGEEVVLEIHGQAVQDVRQPIFGFYVKDRLGQRLFGDNTFIKYRHSVNPVRAGERVSASFRFILPYLPSGDYSVSCAIAEGSQDSHVQHHWIEDALFFKVLSSHVVQGLIGVAMHDITITIDQGSTRSNVEGV
jgi:lipopolysaccharide transport system ATP-binding protein